jgi:multidrug transporter EmrE-like cation transporter
VDLLAIGLALTAAVIHACWSLLSKRLSRYDPAAFIWLASLGSLVAYGPVVLVLTGSAALHPTGTHVVFMAGSILINLGYFMLTQYGYRNGDLSFVYPIARGTGPILATLGGVVLLGQVPSALGFVGLLAVAAGVMTLGLLVRPASSPRPRLASPTPYYPGWRSPPTRCGTNTHHNTRSAHWRSPRCYSTRSTTPAASCCSCRWPPATGTRYAGCGGSAGR